MKLFILATINLVYIWSFTKAQKDTVNDRACILPFQENGNTYDECTKAGAGFCWCPISLSDEGTALDWEPCKESTCANAKADEFVDKDDADNDCATDTTPCIFPFKYNGVEYTECITNENAGYYWCATKVKKGNREMADYANCKEQDSTKVCKTKDPKKAKPYSYSGNEGPDFWGKKFNKACDGKRQSPINIDTKASQEGKFKAVKLTNYDKEITMQILQNGHTVQFNYKSGDVPTVTGGPAGSATYKLAQFHLHWGKTDKQGSEHTIDKVRYPMEIHFVHYNGKYKDLGEAVEKPDGLLVLGFMFAIKIEAKCTDSQMNAFIDDIKGIDKKRMPKDLKKKVKLQDVFKFKDLDKFYTYLGSLTTPPCSESVTWYVNSNVEQLKLCKDILDELNKIEDDATKKKLYDNFRPIQPMNERKVVLKK